MKKKPTKITEKSELANLLKGTNLCTFAVYNGNGDIVASALTLDEATQEAVKEAKDTEETMFISVIVSAVQPFRAVRLIPK